MPAKSLLRVREEKSYSHIYNKGVEGRAIFASNQDYEVFLGYLNDYLTTPADSESKKRDFTVNGKTFRGTPHQPKNYFNQVELVAYSLVPDHFHLLLHQKTHGSLESFIRSLCTRYSMYFNKKYGRAGALFEGPYKSAHIKSVHPLLLLTRLIHRETDGYSSYPEYLGQKETSWVKPEVVLSFFNKSENDAFKGVGGYKNFVEKYEPTEDEEKLLAGITLENQTRRFEEETSAGDAANTVPESSTSSNLSPASRVPEFAAIFAVFILLTVMGLRNISVSKAKNLATSDTPAVLSESTQIETTPEPTATPSPKHMVVVKITDGAERVNIRQKPTINSAKVGEAKDGETFEFVSINSGWFEIKLPNGQTGFILSNYAQNTDIF